MENETKTNNLKTKAISKIESERDSVEFAIVYLQLLLIGIGLVKLKIAIVE